LKTLMSCLVALGLSTSFVGCGTSFDSLGQLDGVRVLGVQKSNPFAEPGEQVELRMLVHDTGPTGGKSSGEERPEVQVAWLSGCTNPPADLYQGCFAQFGQVLSGLGVAPNTAVGDGSGAANAKLLGQLAKAGIGLGFGPNYQFTIPADIISRRPPPARGASPYGLSYVFFAACSGTLVPNTTAGEFPISCIDADGERVSAHDFVAGYTNIYSYPDNSNRNPELLGFEASGKKQKAANTCIGEACEALPWDASRKCDGNEPSVNACADDKNPFECPKLKFKAKVDPASVDADPFLTRDRGSAATEQMWVNYHADRGQFTSEVSLVNDSTAGFNQTLEGEFIAPEEKGKTHVWAVVRDNRGGTAWGRFDICVR